MKIGRLSKEKQTQLILVVIIVIGLLSGLGLGLIQSQFATLKNLAQKRNDATKRLAQMRDAVKNAKQLEADLATAKIKMAELEADTASGDLYSWIISTVRRFKLAYKVEIPQFGVLSAPTDNTLLPDFPYKQVTLTVAGSAHFHDFGYFLAEFENHFPHFRVQNLSLDVDGASLEAEMLAFKMEIVALVKPAQS